jgi:hypothetical protein
MSRQLTLITEIGTGLGMIPRIDLQTVFDGDAPAELEGVDAVTWESLREWWSTGACSREFSDAFEDGRYFYESDLGLRRRPPLTIEWKGPHRSPEDDPLPADLRIDGVFIVSCKNLSKVLLNPSPAALFRSALRNPDFGGHDWYEEIAPVELASLYSASIRHLGLNDFPALPAELNRAQRAILKDRLARRWPAVLAPEVAEFVSAVSARSAALINQTLATKRDRERFYWRLLRIHSAPYFILGRQPSGPARLCVLTPWDFRRRFAFGGLEVLSASAGQPQVQWRAFFTDNDTGVSKETVGHVEIRWSHGRFCGAPESKIYLNTPHEDACGYIPI